jgi:hypothetical protein
MELAMAIMFILGLISGMGIMFATYIMVHNQLIDKGKMYLDHEED